MAGEVITPFARVTVDGVARDATAVRVTREIATDLPGEVVGGGGMVAATGSVDWADDTAGIADGRKDAPAKLSSVVVTAGLDGSAGALSTRFTGMIDSTSGTASEASSASSIVDRSRSLARPVTVVPHLVREVSGANQITPTGLSSLWMAHEAARQAGWGAFHYSSRTALWASLAGSILPHTGAVPGYADVGTWSPVSTPTGGVGIALDPGRQIEYDVDPIGGDGSNFAVEASIWADPSSAGLSDISFYGFSVANGGRGFGLTFGNDTFRAYVIETGQDLIVVNPISSTTYAGFQPIGFHLSWNTQGWTVRVRMGASVWVSSQWADTTAIARANGSDKWTFPILRAPSPNTTTPAVLAGLVIDRQPSTTPQWSEFTYTPKFKTLLNPDDIQSWTASRLVFREDALDLLRAIAAAECAGLWVDEDGVLTFMSRQYMRTQAIAKTYTSSTTLLDYNWADTLDSVRSSVSVKHLLPAYVVRTTANLTVWSADGDQRFKANETTETFVEPDALVDWWQPDLFASWGSVDAKPTVNSWWGGKVKVDSTDAVVRTATSSDATVTTTYLGYQKMLLSFKANAIGAANYLDTMGTPVVRARGKVSWTEQTYTSTITGPSDAPALEHDVGWYVQTSGARTSLANYLATVTNGTYPTLENVQIIPDPDLRLGQRITIQDSHIKGWAFNAVVFRIDETWADGEATMSLGLRVTTFQSDLAATLEQMDERFAGYTLATFDAEHSGDTLTQLDAAPLA